MNNIVYLSGGLGNQMFSYAYAMMLKEKGYNITCDWGLLKNGNEHNGYELEKVFENVESKCTTIMPFILRIVYTFTYIFKLPVLASILKIFGWEYVVDEEKMKAPTSHYNHMLCGPMWNLDYLPKSYRYFFKEECLNNGTKFLANQMNMENSVSIHIRRGDYLSSHYYSLYKGICTEQYYRNALVYIKAHVSNPVFYVFSNDMEWIQSHFSDIDFVIVDCNKGVDSWQDMYLMSRCKHNIIANSTFSWWGAWLNNYSDKIVIRPFKFDNCNRAYNIFPDSWITVNS